MQENTNKTLGFYTFLYFEAVFLSCYSVKG